MIYIIYIICILYIIYRRRLVEFLVFNLIALDWLELASRVLFLDLLACSTLVWFGWFGSLFCFCLLCLLALFCFACLVCFAFLICFAMQRCAMLGL